MNMAEGWVWLVVLLPLGVVFFGMWRLFRRLERESDEDEYVEMLLQPEVYRRVAHLLGLEFVDPSDPDGSTSAEGSHRGFHVRVSTKFIRDHVRDYEIIRTVVRVGFARRTLLWSGLGLMPAWIAGREFPKGMVFQVNQLAREGKLFLEPDGASLDTFSAPRCGHLGLADDPERLVRIVDLLCDLVTSQLTRQKTSTFRAPKRSLFLSFVIRITNSVPRYYVTIFGIFFGVSGIAGIGCILIGSKLPFCKEVASFFSLGGWAIGILLYERKLRQCKRKYR